MSYPRALILIAALAACGRVTTTSADAPMADAIQPEVTCGDLPLVCGPEGTASCCDSKLIPGGMFYRGFDQADYTDQSHPAQVSAFRLDTYEVTVGRFRQFVAAGRGTREKPPIATEGARKLNGIHNQGGWDSAWNSRLVPDELTLRNSLRCNIRYATWTDQPTENDSLPVVCVTWFEAMAFCIWDGGYLPTLAESMYAMGGGSQQRAYPWSNPASSTAISCARANFGGETWPTTACNSDGATRVGAKSPAGDGLFGQADLAGNAIEWVLDWSATLPSGPCNDCANLTAANSRVMRGGSYQAAANALRGASSFSALSPGSRDAQVGVRCARLAK